MDMDKAPLNRAHQLERKAELLDKQKKLDHAIECYTEAVELYQKCLEIGRNQSALEAIQLQKEKVERQIRILQVKKAYIERTARERKIKGIIYSKHSQLEAVEDLQDKIFKNLETHDSLICYLADRGIINARDRHCHSTIEEAEEKSETPLVVGSKHPKSDTVVIEELRELSGQLKGSVQDLLIELDDRNILIEQLRAQIQGLELEKSFKEDLRITPSELDDEESPVSCPDISSDIAELKSLPKLDTLVMPEFDITTFKRFRIPEVNSRLFRQDE